MNFIAKVFDELTTAELYELLKARAKIFVEEQNIRYVDEDDVDYRSLHCFLWENGTVRAYLRAFTLDEGEGIAKVGRVLSIVHGEGLGTKVMTESIPEIKKRLNCSKIVIDAQSHAEEFYKFLGFVTVSDEFMEEGIPHVRMELDI